MPVKYISHMTFWQKYTPTQNLSFFVIIGNHVAVRFLASEIFMYNICPSAISCKRVLGAKHRARLITNVNISFLCAILFCNQVENAERGFHDCWLQLCTTWSRYCQYCQNCKDAQKNKSSLPRIQSALSIPAADFYRIRAVVESREINITAIALLLARARNNVIISCPTWRIFSKGREILGEKMDSNDKR